MEKVSKGTFQFEGEEWDDISKEAKEFIKKMLTYDPGNLSDNVISQQNDIMLNNAIKIHGSRSLQRIKNPRSLY